VRKLKRKRALSVPEQHQFEIAKATLRMPDAMAAVMQSGVPGPNNVTTKEGAWLFLLRIGWSARRIQALEE
jgi:hypothetical protein